MSRPPRITWEQLRAKLVANWQPGEHWTMIGPTGSGKTHAALTIASLGKYTLVIATKRRDPLLEDLSANQLVTTDLRRDVIWAGDRTPIHPRVIHWAKGPAQASAQERLRFQTREIRKALDWADRTGGWVVVIDELMWVSKNLGLERELESMYFQARTQGVSVIGAAQRPRQVPLLALNQSTYLLMWHSADKQDLERLRELSAGFPRGFIDQAVQGLDWHAHEALFVDARRREVATVIMPPKVPM